MSKKQLSEQEIRARYITPAIQAAGWKPQQIREEVTFTAGRIIVRGTLSMRSQVQILNSFGSKIKFLQAVRELEQEIYRAA